MIGKLEVACSVAPARCCRFFSLVLLPCVEEDIEQNRDHKLNYHYYESLKKESQETSSRFS